MPVRWDPLLAAATARALSDALVGARVRAVLLDPDARLVLLHLSDHTLAVELHPSCGWVSLLPPSDLLPEARALAGRVAAVRSFPDDSAIAVEIARKSGRLELVFEMVGNRWNALVVDAGSRRLRAVLLPRPKGTRRLTVGEVYRPPPQTGRRGIEPALDAREWEEIASSGGVTAEGRRRAILAGVAWTSSLNVHALLGENGWERWKAMTDPAAWGSFLLQAEAGPLPYPVPLEGLEAEPAPSLLEAFRLSRARAEEVAPPASLLVPWRLLARAQDRIRRAESRGAALRRELEEPGDPSALRGTGDLILARYNEIPRGEGQVTLRDFDGSAAEVALDPSLPPQENAARFYAEAGRIERAREILPARITEAELELARWKGLASRVRAGELPWTDLDEALGPEPKTARRRPVQQAPALPFRRYSSSGGLEIRVGRGARQNDELTFHHSSPDDIWLHARQTPGAHVILRWGREEGPPRRDLVEAATLAALHSEARGSASVSVVWTRRKHVRKPRRSPPGTVVPERFETLMVEPDPALAARLERGPERS
ncbi:MAG: NFACT RNA binding domain-containing protein [Gemmatimonadota bacterium]